MAANCRHFILSTCNGLWLVQQVEDDYGPEWILVKDAAGSSTGDREQVGVIS